ncbi:hypothetical protein BLOT_014510 [Blomia tropicalis]|nr:hypothetical protein BLOT_014510 [Blomia tropicalis]
MATLDTVRHFTIASIGVNDHSILSIFLFRFKETKKRFMSTVIILKSNHIPSLSELNSHYVDDDDD